jgi:hypothetical protein
VPPGNIGKDASTTSTTPADLTTPHLKGEHYTTGRGGSGNMARNDPLHPELARASQDVEAPAHREKDGPHHYGRGGAANIAKMTPEEVKAEEKRKEREGKEKGLLEKVKGLVGGKK